MRKLIRFATLLTALLCLCLLCACDGGNTPADTPAPTDRVTDAPTEAPTDAPTEAPTEEITEAPTEETTPAETEPEISWEVDTGVFNEGKVSYVKGEDGSVTATPAEGCSLGLDVTDKTDLVSICYSIWFDYVLRKSDTGVD